ncbi:PREDICTED: uncharacterized protein LOC104817426 isoform X2 [Tarenaya hassleriana]|uniref:uncharacterized protein LOC104817426 isoform X2 n=1 Tax=Tarenaya hassleriana TaxID=28532 RepID=UPI00053C9158|nr:PREDICTED: uncharacterized protein LOC104817426 isoform X2 [Tarenaya hassleriana]
MSEFRSSGSNYFPCSQSRKMSIGVLVGSPPERNLEPNKGDGNALPRVEKLNSATAADLEMNKKDKNNSAVNHVNPAQAPDHLTSPWRSPRTSYKKLGTLENVLSKQTSNLSYSKGTWKGLNEVNQAPAAYSVQRHPVATFQSNDCKSNRYVRKKGNGGLSERMEESTPVVSQEKVTSEGMAMDKPDNAENGSTDALRTKLWEILGKGSSPKKQHSNSEVPEVVDNNSDLRQDKDPNGDPLVKPRHNSDPIETDSESPVNATQRPVTRSLLLKRVSGKETQKKPKAGANLGRKKIEQENNIFSFEEGLLGKIDPAMNVSSMPKKQKTGRRTVNQCRKAHSLEKVDAEGILREKDKHEILPSENVRADKTSSLSNTKGRFGGFAYKDKAPLQKLQSDIREEDFHQPQAKETSTKPGILRGTSESRGKHEGLSNPFKENPVEPLDDFHSPTLGYPTPICSPSPCFSPAVTPSHLSDNSPMLEETETPIFSFGTKKNSQTACQATNTEQESSDFLEKSRDYRYRRDSSAEPIEDSVGLSESSSDERDSNGSEEDSHAMRHYHYSGEEERRNSLHGCRRKSLFVLHSAQRNSNPAGTRLDEPSPTLSSPKGIHETDCFPGSSELNGDDGLGRFLHSVKH